MATAQAIVREPQQIRLSLVDWRTYSRLLRALGDRPGVYLTFDRGELEIMSPLPSHESIGYLLARFVAILTEELGLELFGGKSTTLRRRKKMRGLEPDECFWIANERLIRGKDTLDLRIDPPPDLGLEIDMTSSSMNRMAIYAALKVPEVWRYENDSLTFHVLTAAGDCVESETSLAFPMLRPADLMAILSLRRQLGHNALAQRFRDWVREKIQKGEGERGA
jgi:Uma2 family endonuclease